ncbi:MAG: hypothetical protein KAS23_15385 [Anaerohalosphaera sp.]|nr:hypothetical protein [Anaerohalosphaera sp.]
MKKVILLLMVVSVSANCCGMATEDFGPDKDRDHPTHAQPGWQKGIVAVPKHPSRVYSMWCNGGENFYFKADPNQINELIDLFSRAYMRDHQLVITDKKEHVKSFRGKQIDYNVSLNMTGGILLGMRRSGDLAQTYEPVLTIYVVKDADILKRLKLPDNIILNCEIEGVSLKSKLQKPSRKLWHGLMQFKDADWYKGCVNGLVTRITLWQKGVKEPIEVSKVGVKGNFSIPFSEHEFARLKKGDWWLTITIGNWLTNPKSDHPKIALETLNTDKAKVETIIISQPSFYHGRILFEDGTPPRLDPAPWPGAEIMVDFSYAGSANIDHLGYFQVFFTDEQYEKLKTKKPGKNIYIPSCTEKGRSTARVIFPVTKLSKEKSNAGVVKIQRPQDYENDRKSKAVDPAKDIESVVQGNSKFAFDLYAKLAADKKLDGNMFFSPYSISTALGMTWAGTRGDTETKFADTMHYPLPQVRQHSVFAILEKQLNTGGANSGYQLSVANSLWGQIGEPFRKDFLELTNKYYGAGIRELDFTSSESAEKARQIINGWVEKKTKDKIKELIAEGLVDDAILVLTNAIYFKGDWNIQFDKKNTKDRPFNISPDEKAQVQMMYLKDDFKYWGDKQLQVIELPYKGEHLSMIVLLPKEIDGIDKLEKQLTVDNLNGWLGNLRKQEVSILLPKFKITWGTIELVNILKEMGLPLKGDYTGISDDAKLYISNILHKAFVAVDEKGTEAAAATAVVMKRTSMGPVFRADRPFVFMIRDNRSGSLLFMGRVTNPAENE